MFPNSKLGAGDTGTMGGRAILKGKSLMLTLGGGKQLPVRCMVGIFNAVEGDFKVKSLVFGCRHARRAAPGRPRAQCLECLQFADGVLDLTNPGGRAFQPE